MGPKLVDSFVNGRITLEVYQFVGPLDDTYWIKAGAACIELNEQDLSDLTELLIAFKDQDQVISKKRSWRRLWMKK